MRRIWSKPLVGALLIALVGTSFALRTVHYRALSTRGGSLISDPDSLYHLRLARLIARQFPRVPAFDSYLNYPAGADVPWPFLQDFSTAALSLTASGNAPFLERICFFYPAAVGSLSLVLVFLLSRAFGLRPLPSLVASVGFSLVPAQIGYTMGGRYDHHAGDLLYAPLFFLTILKLWLLRGRPAGDVKHFAAQAWLVLASLLMFLNWLGASVYLAMLLGAVALTEMAGWARRTPQWPDFLWRTGIGLSAAAVVLAAVFAGAYAPGRLAVVVSDKPSAFQPLLLLGSGLMLIATAEKRRSPEAGRRPRLWIALAILLTIFAALLAALVHVASTYLVAGSRSFLTVQEFRSILVDPHSDFLHPRYSLGRLFDSVTWGILLFPLFCVGIWRRGLAGSGGRAFPEALFFTFCAAQLLMALRQFRHGSLLAVPLAIGLSWLVASAANAVRDRARKPATRVAALAVGLVAMTAVAPGVRYFKKKIADPFYNQAHYGLMRSMAALQRLTPAPSDFLDTTQRPTYGVMSFWDVGHAVISAGRRPALATGFLDTFPGDAYRQSMQFFVEDDPAAARQIMERNNLRYVVLYNNSRAVVQAAFTLGEDASYQALVKEGMRALHLRGELPVSVRLWESRGKAIVAGGRTQGSTRHFRLIWEDWFLYPADGTLDRCQIYELVPGAVLEGTAPVGSRVSARIPLVSNLGVRFAYEEVVQADASGRFEMTVPYSTEEPSGAVRPEGVYRVQATNGPAREIRVDNAAVTTGMRIAVETSS